MKRKLLKKLSKFTIGKCIYFVIAFIFFLVTLFPLYFTVVSSLKLDNEIWGTMFQLPSQPHWENYIQAAEAVKILDAIWNSVFLSVGSVAIMIVFVMMSSYVFARRLFKYGNILYGYLFAALMIPLQGAIVPIVQMVGLVHGRNNFFVMMLIYVGLNISLSTFIMVNYINGISREIDEAAAIDGCNLFQIVFKVILPIAKPGVATAAIIGFLNVYNELPIANVVLTKAENRTVSVALLAFQGDYQISLSLIFASIVIVIIPILIFYLLCQEKVENGLAAGAVKG